MANRWENNGNSERLYFGGFQNHCRWGDCSCEIKRRLLLGRKTMTNLGSTLKSCLFNVKNRHYLANKGPSSQSYGFSSSHVWMWELDYKESWVLKNWCLQIVMLEKTIKSPLDSKEIKLVNTNGNQSWIFIGRTDAETETPILWSPDTKNWFTEKDPDAGKDWRQEEKGMTGWDGWMASSTQWTWVWASSGSWWQTGKPGVLQSMGSQRVGCDWMTELNWLEIFLWRYHLFELEVRGQEP